MAYTTTTLITRAYYLSGVVGRDYETPSGSQLQDGLDLLNALLDIKTANDRLIPYFKEYDLTSVTNQETYFIPNLVRAESLTFTLNQVRFSMVEQSRKDYFASPRVNNISALPFHWHQERLKGGTNIYIYFLPSDNYPLQLWGKFSLADVTLGQDLSLTLDLFYIEYLRYALAEYLCAENNILFQPQAQKKLDEYELIITDISPIDLTTQKASTLQKDSGYNWAYINLGRGYVA